MLQASLEKQIKRMENRLGHAKKRATTIKERQQRIKDDDGAITEHGGWELGYWECKVSTLEDTIDELKELSEPKSTNAGILLDNVKRGR